MSTSCWASIVGGCSDKASDEHPAGRHGGLLTDVRVLGFAAELEDKVVPIDALKRRILCEAHNNQLGKEVDPEAHRAYRSIRQWFYGEYGQETDSGLWTPTVVEISGPLFLRWLCKYSCNMQAMEQNAPDVSYARVALGLAPTSRVHLYLRTDRFEFRRRIRYQDYRVQWPGEPEKLVFRVLFMGFEFLVTPRPLTHLGETLFELDPVADGEWMERPARLAQPHRQGGVDGSVLHIRWPE